MGEDLKQRYEHQEKIKKSRGVSKDRSKSSKTSLMSLTLTQAELKERYDLEQEDIRRRAQDEKEAIKRAQRELKMRYEEQERQKKFRSKSKSRDDIQAGKKIAADEHDNKEAEAKAKKEE